MARSREPAQRLPRDLRRGFSASSSSSAGSSPPRPRPSSRPRPFSSFSSSPSSSHLSDSSFLSFSSSSASSVGRSSSSSSAALEGCLLVGVDAVGHEVEDGAQLAERVDRLALDEMGVLLLADLVLDLVDGELALEVEEVVQHLHAAAREVVEQVGVRPVLLVEDVGQHEELLLRLEDRLLDALEAHLAGAEVLLDAEGDEGRLEQVLVEAVVAQRVDELDQMGDLAGVDDAQAVDIPAHGVARLADPPVVVFAEPDDAPIESGSGLCHGFRIRRKF